MDSERQPIDTIVIHHTSLPPGILLTELNALQRERLYERFYATAKKGEPISLGHIRDGQEVFYAYHWLVRQDGKVERLLHDDEIGWHSGNWETNCRSIAICFDDDLEHGHPSKSALKSAADIIRQHYAQVSKERIFGHCEVKSTTACPSRHFLAYDGEKGWKEDLLKLL